jgi:hypothetical protein
VFEPALSIPAKE